MITVIATLESISPYSQNGYIAEPRKERESADEHERRCWRQRMNTNAEGHVVIPPMAFYHCLCDAAKYLNMKVKGQGNSTYTAKIKGGVVVSEPLELPNVAAEVEGEWLLLPSNGKRGGGSKVPKCMPLILSWSGGVKFEIIDPIITKDVFTTMLEAGGMYIGIGRFRPQNMGYYGRFSVAKVKWGK